VCLKMGQHTPRIGFRGTVFSVWPRLKRWVEQLRPSTTTGREVLTPSRPWGHPQFLFYFGLHLHYIHSESPFILSHFWLTVENGSIKCYHHPWFRGEHVQGETCVAWCWFGDAGRPTILHLSLGGASSPLRCRKRFQDGEMIWICLPVS
jgi:hypothetical protein